MAGKEDVLLELAQEITDGEPVDWNEAMKTHEELQGAIKKLRVMESIAAALRSSMAHRSPQSAHRESSLSFRTTLSDLSDSERGSSAGEELDLDHEAPRSWGQLEILGRLGKGGFGEVFHAFDPTLQKDVALKLIRIDGRRSRRDPDRFIREARKHAKVQSENVIPIHGADEHDGRVGIWMDLIEGETLEESLRKHGRLRPDQAAADGIEICRALAAVHGKGLVHRDVKTGNVMRTNDGRIVLMDFSASAERAVENGSAGGDAVSGTPLFTAPEVFRGESPDVTADLYSLGVVLYRLVTGRFPVESQSLSELREKHEEGAVTPLLDYRPDASRPFVQVVERALNPDPRRRYGSAGEMARALEDCLVRRWDEAREKKRARRWPRWASVAAAAIVLTVIGWFAVDRLFFSPLVAEARLYRLGPASEERLASGAKVRPGEQFFLEISGSDQMHVYVLNEDAAGNSSVLFPLPELGLENPLSPDTLHRLPGLLKGALNYWNMGPGTGRETFHVIASRNPMPDLEEVVASMSHVVERSPHRGVVSLGPATGVPGTGTGSPAVAEILRTLKDETDPDHWLWQIQLENTGGEP